MENNIKKFLQILNLIERLTEVQKIIVDRVEKIEKYLEELKHGK